MIEVAVEQIRNGNRFLVACHRRPDADALGSAVGMLAALRALGKEAVLFLPEELPASLRFLVAGVEPVSEVAGDERFDATWVMDLAAAKLLPPSLPDPAVRGTLIVVDHHYAHDDVGDVVVRDTNASATGEVVMRLIDALGIDPLPPLSVSPLYAAIVSDTGGFRYRNTRPETLRLGARLVEAGADPWQVAYELFERWEPQRIELLRAVLGTLTVTHDGKVATLRVTRDTLDQCNATDDMVEGIVNYARRLEGVHIGALLWEWPVNGESGVRIDTRVSLRSSNEVDVSKVAVALGGGGHRAAAAAQLSTDIDSAAARLSEELSRLLG